MAGLSARELQDLRDTVGGALGTHWPGPTAAGLPDAPDARLRSAWGVAAAQGWTDLSEDGAVDALMAVTGELGRLACPLPLVDVYVACELLGDDPVVARIAAGTVRPVIAIGAAKPDRTVRFSEAAQAATHVLIVPFGGGTARLHPVGRATPTAGLAQPPWCDIDVDPTTAATVEVGAHRAEQAVVLLRLGLAVRAMGAARRAADLALEHAKNRKQFGQPIGRFQAVANRCVDAAIDIAAFGRLADEAVRLHLQPDSDQLLGAELAVAYALEAAPRVQLGAHHTLAAMGYFEEHEAPWLFRRVHADVARLVGLPLAAGEAADVLVEGRRGLPQLRLAPEAETLRTEVRAFLAEHLPGGWAGEDADLVALLAERGWVAPALSREHGGLGATVEEQVAINEELAYHGVAPVMRTAAGMLGPSIARHGTPTQKAHFLPLIARGQFPFYLGYSEPETGSDLASLRTRAIRDGPDWLINGTKMWGTGAYAAKWTWLAARTDPDAHPRHAGITVFLFPTGLPGWSMQQHTALSGERSCTTFFDDVRIPDSARVGPVNGGWQVLMEALAQERIVIASGTARLLRLFDDLLEVVGQDPDGTVGPRGSTGRRSLNVLASRLHAARAFTRAGAAEAAMAKIVGSELEEEFGELALRLLGPEAALESGPRVPAGRSFEGALRFSIMAVVAGGTNDVQRNLVARDLGLPRSS